MKHETDEYGIGASAAIAVGMFAAAMRDTGRTTRMIERCKEGDQIVVPSTAIERHVKMLLQDAGKKDVRTFVVAPHMVPMSRVGTSVRGTTYFDHTWIEQYYAFCIRAAEKDFHTFQIATSKVAPAAFADKAAFGISYDRGRWESFDEKAGR